MKGGETKKRNREKKKKNRITKKRKQKGKKGRESGGGAPRGETARAALPRINSADETPREAGEGSTRKTKATGQTNEKANREGGEEGYFKGTGGARHLFESGRRSSKKEKFERNKNKEAQAQTLPRLKKIPRAKKRRGKE